MDIRVGFGYDVHRLEEGIPLWLGGVRMESVKGAVGHSDADVLLHAICDALLGAAGLKDIGHYFPDTSAEFKGIDSKILLKRVVELLQSEGYRIGNIDSTLVLEKPKIKDYVDDMKRVIAAICGVDEGRVSIKATTSEKLGFVGRQEGLSAQAVTLILKG
jgi:2-C-methyl-D-erythritol 2,4-cyclodiphosphate synthase